MEKWYCNGVFSEYSVCPVICHSMFIFIRVASKQYHLRNRQHRWMKQKTSTRGIYLKFRSVYSSRNTHTRSHRLTFLWLSLPCYGTLRPAAILRMTLAAVLPYFRFPPPTTKPIVLPAATTGSHPTCNAWLDNLNLNVCLGFNWLEWACTPESLRMCGVTSVKTSFCFSFLEFPVTQGRCFYSMFVKRVETFWIYISALRLCYVCACVFRQTVSTWSVLFLIYLTTNLFIIRQVFVLIWRYMLKVSAHQRLLPRILCSG
jgi:hypothetical protein